MNHVDVALVFVIPIGVRSVAMSDSSRREGSAAPAATQGSRLMRIAGCEFSLLRTRSQCETDGKSAVRSVTSARSIEEGIVAMDK
jgi:hypothetical protein